MSHYHTTLGEKLDASQRRDIAQSELLADFLDKLKTTKEADGSSLFDHIALVYGSNIRTALLLAPLLADGADLEGRKPVGIGGAQLLDSGLLGPVELEFRDEK
jgi:hypothetical protein